MFKYWKFITFNSNDPKHHFLYYFIEKAIIFIFKFLEYVKLLSFLHLITFCNLINIYANEVLTQKKGPS